ncbi:O-antigen ligase family protein, partial [Candidatus Sumerlaeota bacterium]|nr:O-antigen ligase family protein [Candidatus Sumerlaeota bacterium]
MFENHSRVGRAITTGFAIAAISVCIYRGMIRATHLRPFVKSVLLVYAAIIVSCYYSIEKLYSFKNFLYYQHLWFGVLFLCIAAWATTRARQYQVLLGFAVAGLVSAILGLVVLYHGRQLVNAGIVEQLTDFVYKAQDSSGAPYYRAKGMLESYTKSASVFIMVLPAMIALLMHEARRRRLATTAMIVAAMAVCGWYLMMTKSRGAWIGAGLACVGTLVMLRGKWWIPVAGIAAIMVAGLLVPSVRARASSFVSDATRPDLLLSGRFALWEQGLEVIRGNPIHGIGYGGNIFLTDNGLALHELRSAGFRQPDLHQAYLQILAETGLLGFAAYALFLILLLRTGFIAVRAHWGSGIPPGLAVAFPALVGILVFGFVYNFNERHVAQLLATMLGLIVAPLRETTAKPSKP